MMGKELANEIIDRLVTIKINASVLEKEEALEDYLYTFLSPLVQKYNKTIKCQPKTYKERVQKPDISIGLGEILIEIKILDNIDGLYRIFYQVVKYIKIAKDILILFIIDRNDILKDDDTDDLLSLVKKPKTLKIIRRRQ